eukprot:1859046-Amphidinium_carterae.1
MFFRRLQKGGRIGLCYVSQYHRQNCMNKSMVLSANATFSPAQALRTYQNEQAKTRHVVRLSTLALPLTEPEASQCVHLVHTLTGGHVSIFLRAMTLTKDHPKINSKSAG